MEGSFGGFWRWWAEAASRIAGAIDKGSVQTLVEEISQHVKGIHPDLAWELGPGVRAQHNLTISPEGNISLRRVTERWARSAPRPDPVWEFYPARQAAPNLSLTIGGQTLKSTEWLLVPELDQGRLVLNLTAYHPVLRKFPEKERPRIGFIALDQMFGEDAVEKWLGSLRFTTEKTRNGASAEEVLRRIAALEAESKEEIFTLAQGTNREGQPLFLNFNQRLKRLDHLFAETRVQLDLQLQRPTPNGLPTGDELGELNQLEDELLKPTVGDVYVGRLTGAGQRSMHFYSENPQRLMDVLGARVAKAGWRHGLRSENDPDWSFYGTGLFADFAQAN